ncbi:MAG TPA: sigma-70 family RNA polymerase sigma factor [Terriglobia bacterium]|nr:sigma-70 family RNA polymerase sigma factor [Terriglobia bacterium]
MPLARDSVRDVELVTACLNGDQAAWAELIRSYQRLIYSVARLLCPDLRDADEVFQQVCLELYLRLAAVQDVASLPKWLVIVTRRQSITLLRTRRQMSNFDENHFPSDPRVEAIEHRYAVQRALEQMPDRCRRLLTDLYFSEEPLTYAKVAERMQIPVASVGPTRARCLEKLRAMFEAV